MSFNPTPEERAYARVCNENPGWPLAEVSQVIGSVSPYMSDEGRRIQERYRELVKEARRDQAQ